LYGVVFQKFHDPPLAIDDVHATPAFAEAWYNPADLLDDQGRCTPPTTLFDQTMEVRIGDKRLVLTHLGSAHTRGDVLCVNTMCF
jgi:hypothetical protein